MRKYLILISMILLMFIPNVVFAAGISIYYDGYPNEPIFNATNIKPGDTFSKIVTVTNGNSISEDIGVKITSSTTGILANAILITIRDGATNGIINAQSISGYVSAGEIPLGTLAPSTSRDYIFIANFNSSYGNAYQGLTETFDMSLGFIGTPTITGGAPTGTAGTAGNPLTRLSAAVAGFLGFTPTETATVTTPEVKGEVKGDNDTKGSQEQTGITRTCPWWWIIALILLAVLAFIGGVIRAVREDHFMRKYYYVWPVLFGAVAWVAHYFLHKGFTATWFCDHYWLVVILIAALAESLYWVLIKKSKKENI